MYLTTLRHAEVMGVAKILRGDGHYVGARVGGPGGGGLPLIGGHDQLPITIIITVIFDKIRNVA